MKPSKESLKKAFFITLIPIFAVLLYIAPSLNARNGKILEPIADSNNEVKIAAKEEAKNIEDFINLSNWPKNLPIGAIYGSKANNSKGTAILIPQTHRYPGSNPGDKINNNAETAQKEIYEIISYLLKEGDLSFIMTEGYFYGPVAEKEINNLSKKIELRNKLAAQADEINSLVENKNSIEKDSLKEIDNLVASLDREIILAGAPYLIKARGNNITLFGSETKETYEESANIVRNYVYLKDRKSQIESSTGQNNLLTVLRLAGSLSLDNVNDNNSVKTSLKLLSNYASLSGNKQLVEKCSQINNTCREIEELKKEENISSSGVSRANNPYKSINSLNKINSLIGQSEAQIQEVVVERRNKETAENFLKALQEQDIKTGILQFGAEHEEGLVKELNAAGISVIVVKSKKVSEK